MKSKYLNPKADLTKNLLNAILPLRSLGSNRRRQ